MSKVFMIPNRFLLTFTAPLILTVAAHAQSVLPDSRITPGAVNHVVNQGDIDQTICVHGWTRTVRPGDRYTDRLKIRQIAAMGYRDTNPHDYEEDHLIPLDLGGSPKSRFNLWPEPHLRRDQWGSRAKDRLEVILLHRVCKRRLSLQAARTAIARNWILAFKQYIGPTPDWKLRRRDDRRK
jgi:hypothetical protein